MIFWLNFSTDAYTHARQCHNARHLKLELASNPNNKKYHFSFENVSMWSNQKAWLAGMLDWKPFDPREIRQHFGLCVLHGLSPTPRVEYKLKSQKLDCVAGNDFVYSSFDATNAERRHDKHFKSFLSCVGPLIDPPPRNSSPNWKVYLIIKWMNHISPKLWDANQSVLVDEMTMRFKGRHRDKRRITYKAEGDEFQADALCDAGYTYQVCYLRRNEPAPLKYLKLGLSPLHSGTMWLCLIHSSRMNTITRY